MIPEAPPVPMPMVGHILAEVGGAAAVLPTEKDPTPLAPTYKSRPSPAHDAVQKRFRPPTAAVLIYGQTRRIGLPSVVLRRP